MDLLLFCFGLVWCFCDISAVGVVWQKLISVLQKPCCDSTSSAGGHPAPEGVPLAPLEFMVWFLWIQREYLLQCELWKSSWVLNVSVRTDKPENLQVLGYFYFKHGYHCPTEWVECTQTSNEMCLTYFQFRKNTTSQIFFYKVAPVTSYYTCENIRV